MANKALLVGINKYKIPGADLNGCANDVTNMRDVLLKYFGFFTCNACKHIRDVKGRISRGESLKRVRASLKFNGFSHAPRL